jgi:hypothetical protein
VRPKARGTTVFPIDRIFDPYVKNEEGESVGDYVDIAYVTGTKPATAKEKATDIIGRIQFTYTSDGRIGIRGGNRTDELLFQFLYLTNQNRNTTGKAWSVPGSGKKPLFFIVEPSKTAKDKNDFRRKVRMAGEAIDKMPDSKLRDFAIGLDMKSINTFSGVEEIKDQLYKVAEKDPDKIIGLDKDASLKIKIDIKEAEKLGVIERDTNLGMMVWPDTKEPICTIPPGKDMYTVLTAYFLGKGSEAYSIIKQLVEKKQEAQKAGKAEKAK